MDLLGGIGGCGMLRDCKIEIRKNKGKTGLGCGVTVTLYLSRDFINFFSTLIL